MRYRVGLAMTAVVMGCLMMWRGWSSFSGFKPAVLSATSDLTIEDRIVSLERRVAALEKKTTTAKSKATASESFVQLAGGTAFGGEWIKIPGSEFWFDASFYSGLSEVTWQGWVDNGFGYVRLYDNSNHRAVDGSEVLVNSTGKASFYSTALSIWRGQNQYYVEVKSPIGSSVTVSSPRLKLVVK